jgi:hypothetical protein
MDVGLSQGRPTASVSAYPAFETYVQFLEALAGNKSPAEGAEFTASIFALWGGTLLDQWHGKSQQFGVFENESAEWRGRLLRRCVFPTTEGGWRSLEGRGTDGLHSGDNNGSSNMLVVNDNESLAKLFRKVPGLWFLHCPFPDPIAANKIKTCFDFFGVSRLSHLVQENVGGTKSEEWMAVSALSRRSCVRGVMRVCIAGVQRWLYHNHPETYRILEGANIATTLGELAVVCHPALHITYRLEHTSEASVDGEDRNAHSNKTLLHSCSVERYSFYESKARILHIRLDTLQPGSKFARELTGEFVRIMDESLRVNGVASLQTLQVSSGRELEDLLSVLVMQSAACGGDEAIVDETVADVLESRHIPPLPPKHSSWLITGEALAACNDDIMRATEAKSEGQLDGGDCGNEEENTKPPELDYSGKMSSYVVSRKTPTTTVAIRTPVWPPGAPTIEMRGRAAGGASTGGSFAFSQTPSANATNSAGAPFGGFGNVTSTPAQTTSTGQFSRFGNTATAPAQNAGAAGVGFGRFGNTHAEQAPIMDSRNDVESPPEVAAADGNTTNSNADVGSLKVGHDILVPRNVAPGTATIAQFLERFERMPRRLDQAHDEIAATSRATTFAAVSSSSSFGINHWPTVDTAKLAHECFVVDVELQDRDTTFNALSPVAEGLSKAASSKNGSGERAAAVLGEYLVFSALQKG